MKKAYLFITDGSEEVEALTVVDLLRRAGIKVDIVSTTDSLSIEGSHGIHITADSSFADHDYADADLLILPGGMPGTIHLREHEGLGELLKAKAGDDHTYLAAICAGPTVLGCHGLLQGKKAVCYPGFEKELDAGTVSNKPVVQDGHVVTARGLGAAIPFALKLIEIFEGPWKSGEIAAGIVFK